MFRTIPTLLSRDRLYDLGFDGYVVWGIAKVIHIDQTIKKVRILKRSGVAFWARKSYYTTNTMDFYSENMNFWSGLFQVPKKVAHMFATVSAVTVGIPATITHQIVFEM